MDVSNGSRIPVSSNLAWPTCTAPFFSGINTMKPSIVNDRSATQALLIEGVGLPVYQITQQEAHVLAFQSPATNFAIDNVNLSVVLAPQTQPVPPECPAQALTLNIMNPVPILSQNCPTILHGASLAKAKNIGKHKCSHCGRDCLKPSVLEKHMRSHTGERPFPCTICGISFKTQSNLYKHRRTQTHVNNAKQSFDSDCSGCLEHITGQVGDTNCLDITKAVESIRIDKDQNQENTVGFRNTIPMAFSIKNHEKAFEETSYSSPTKNSTFVFNQKITLKDQWPTTNKQTQLQRQSETCIDKLLDSSSSQRKLKKCESTDSGYLSHSDSADLQMFSGSPLHSLSESSFESEPMLGSGTFDSEEKTSSSKKNLEEHISMLISQNKALVDNTLLENVRPRKTALSKQGSIDLPMPYTFKDSFHFDIKSRDANRKKLPTTLNFIAPEKNKCQFFHSVPTQISSSIDNVILARSNSLPFVENGRVQDRFPLHNTKAQQGKHSLHVSFANLLLSNTATACTVDFSSSHPRGLVRQTAVDEMPASNASENPVYDESKVVKKPETDQLTPKCKSASRKAGRKKTNMFSHEKWQIYGDETFKKFYQKVNKSDETKKTATSPQTCLAKTISVIGKETKTSFTFGNVVNVADLGLESRESVVAVDSASAGVVHSEGQMKFQYPGHIPLSSQKADGAQFSFLGQVTQSTVHSEQAMSTTKQVEFQNKSEKLLGNIQNNKTSILETKGNSEVQMEDPLSADNLKHSTTDEPHDSLMLPVHNNAKQGTTDTTTGVVSGESMDDINNHQPAFCPLGQSESQTTIFSVLPSLTVAQTISTQKDNLFSPRYLIKFDYIGPNVGSSTASQTDQEHVSVEENNLFGLTTYFQQSFQHNIAKQVNLLQKHDSVITPFSKINLNSDCVLTSATTISIHVTQSLIVDAQGRSGRIENLDEPFLPRQSRIQDVKESMSKESVGSDRNAMEQECISGCICTPAGTTAQESPEQLYTPRCEHQSPSPSMESSQHPWLLGANSLQAKFSDSTSVTLKEQESSMYCTAQMGCHSGICNVRVTKVTFSTLNTEPKSTWCWLDKCLPLPTERKEKSYSIYASLNSVKDREPDKTPFTDKNPGTPVVDSLASSFPWKSFRKKALTVVLINVMLCNLVVLKMKPATADEETAAPEEDEFEQALLLDVTLFEPSEEESEPTVASLVTPPLSAGRGSGYRTAARIREWAKAARRRSATAAAAATTVVHQNGDVLQGAILFGTRHETSGRINTFHHDALLPRERKEEQSEGGSGMKNQINEGTTLPLFAPVQQLITGVKANLQLPEEFAFPKYPQGSSLSWQKSYNPTSGKEGATSDQVTPDIKRIHLQQDLVDGPPQKHGRKILQRSKTIGHHSGEESAGLNTLQCIAPLLPHVDLKPRTSAGSNETACRPSPQNSAESIDNCAHANITGKFLEPDEISAVGNISAHSPNLEHKSPKYQKKVNLEVMRKQTHVEYSDCSSDDEDRLYIEERD
ncbi:zinc finger protein 831 [Gastrophryne carolinensis]